MSNGFVHSVRVPRLYKCTADIVRRVREDGANLKSLIYEAKHVNISGIYGLSTNTLRVLPQLDQLLKNTKLLVEQPRLDPWLARVLITELLWRKKKLQSEAKPIQTVLAYTDKLKEEVKNLECPKPISHKNKAHKPRYVRINTLLLSVDEAISFFQEEGWELLPRSTTYSLYLLTISRLSEPYFIQDFHIPEVLIFPPGTFFHKHPGYEKGKLLLQDKASCLPVHLLNPDVGSTVLDMCAAPGMKATHIAAKLQNIGTVYAVEIDTARFKTLVQFVEKTNSFCVQSLNQDALTLDPKQYSSVEYVLVDPSCSGSGIVDRPEESDIVGKTDSERLKNLQSIQVYLLRYALFNFPKAKKIIYSTCSIYPEENEEVIDEVLADIGDAYHLVPVKQLLPNWTNFSSEQYHCGDKCLYAKSDIDFCNGFFVAVFERNFDVPIPECTRKGGNAYSVEVNPEIKRDNKAKEVPHQKKRGRNENTEELLTLTGKVRAIQSVPETKNQVATKAKTNKSRKEVEGTDGCLSTNLNHEEIASKSENVQKESENLESKKSKKKKKSKHKDISAMEENNEIIEISEDTNEPTKKKKKKKKDNKEDETLHVAQKEQNETKSLTKKKKKKHVVDTIQIGNSEENKECGTEKKKKKKKERDVNQEQIERESVELQKKKERKRIMIKSNVDDQGTEEKVQSTVVMSKKKKK